MISRDSFSGVASKFPLFVLVGLLNTVVGYAIYAGFVLAGTSAQVALIFQFVFGATWNYFTHARLVFDARGYGRMPAYFACYAGIYLFNAVALKLVMSQGVTALWAQAMILPFTVVLSFVLISRVLRSPEDAEQMP